MTKRYRVGIIGSTGKGDYGHELHTAWLEIPQTEIVGLADDNPKGLADTRVKLKLAEDQCFADYLKMLDTTKPEIVCICQRWVDRHAEMALACIERGMHVYMEKPFCRTPAEADAIVDACDRTHVRLTVAHPTRYAPVFPVLKRLIDEGKIGKVVEFRARGKEDHRGGGEDLWVLGTHLMDMILGLKGMPAWCFATVRQQGHPITRDDVGPGNEGIGPLAGDSINAMYGFPDGVMAYFASTKGMGRSPSRYGLQIFGTEGIFEIVEGPMPIVHYLKDSSWSPARGKSQWVPVSSAGIGQPEPIKYKGLPPRHAAAILDLIQAIEQKKEPLGNARVARSGVEMITAIFESQRIGRPATLPLKSRVSPLTLL